MATAEQVPSSIPASASPPQIQPLQAWLGRLGLSGKILAIGGLVGVIAVFLPLITMSFHMQVPGGKGVPAVSTSQSVLVIGDFRGILCLLGYAGAIALTFVLYSPKGLSQKNLGWAGVGVGGFITLMALWLLITALNGSGSLLGFQVSVGIGGIVNLLAAAAVATGGVLKAREERLF